MLGTASVSVAIDLAAVLSIPEIHATTSTQYKIHQTGPPKML
jgi:hypothetical protein